MKCGDMAEQVTLYMEGALPPGTRLSVRMHLWLCASCRRYITQMRKTVRFLADGPAQAAPENESEIIRLMMSRRREP